MCMCLGVCALRACSTQGGQKRASDALELELEVVVRCLDVILGAKSESSARTVGAVHWGTIYVAPKGGGD